MDEGIMAGNKTTELAPDRTKAVTHLSLGPAPPSVQSGPVYAGCTHTRLIWVSQGDSSFPLEKRREPGFLRAR